MAGLVESKNVGRTPLILGGILLAADAFGLDLWMSPNFAIGVPYALVVVLGLWWTDQTYIITAAIVGSVLCLLGFYFSFSSDQLWMGVVDRGFAIFVIWLVAVLCFFHKKEKIEKLELLRQNDRIGQEQFAMENTLKESREKLQDLEKESNEKLQELEKDSRGKIQELEKDTALLRLRILEKEALLDQMEGQFSKVNKTLKEQEDRLVALAEGQSKGMEEFERLQESLNWLQEEQVKLEERLLDKDAQIEKAEEDRNRTAGSLWEKEQRLADVLDDLSLLEIDLQSKTASINEVKEALEQSRGQLQQKDDNLMTMETRLNNIQEELQEKERLLKQVEFQLLEVENQSQGAQKNLQDREDLLKKIEQQIHESLAGNIKTRAPKEFERIALEHKEKQKKQIERDHARQQEGLQKSQRLKVERLTPDRGFAQKDEYSNGKNPSQDEQQDDEKIKNRLSRYTRELERSNEDLREFASIASHDLQEPIRKIIGFGMRLKKDGSPYLDDKGRDYLERMERSAKKMQKFVDDLLQYSKATVSSTRCHSVNLKEVVSQVLTLLEARMEETHPKIEVGPLPVIESDRMQMVQLFQNLISNALKFHKKGEPPVVRISHRLLENGFHEIRVQDQGIGFNEKDLDRIFKPFERLHGNGDYDGTGMGLAICKKIVRRHGGELTAESSPQGGSTFIITLPPLRGEEARHTGRDS
jgi:signal transduction histidine kinase